MTTSLTHPQASSLVTWGADAESARLAVLAVHGRGQDPEFMREQSLRLDVPGLRFYAPEAPGNSWYPHPFQEPLERNEPQLSASLATIGALIDEIVGDGFALDRIVFWGFSQGACLIAQHLLVFPCRPAAVILTTGGHLGPDAWTPRSGAPLAGLPVLLRSANHDPFVPAERVVDTAVALEAMGAEIDLLIRAGREHVITDEAISSTSRLLNRIAALTGTTP